MVELMDIGVAVEWVNDIGISDRDRNICLGAAKMQLDQRDYKWGDATITGVIITINDTREEHIKFDIDFRVVKPMKVMKDAPQAKSTEADASESRNKETRGPDTGTPGQHT